jgi:hypothetical protein
MGRLGVSKRCIQSPQVGRAKGYSIHSLNAQGQGGFGQCVVRENHLWGFWYEERGARVMITHSSEISDGDDG